MELTKEGQLMDELVYQEWEQFTRVNNIGGRAGCQDDFRTFSIMRKSQYQAWSREAMESWLTDLKEAVREGRNLLSEKYAWMMRDTAPAEFRQLKGNSFAAHSRERSADRRTDGDAGTEQRAIFPALSRPVRTGQSASTDGCASRRGFGRDLCQRRIDHLFSANAGAAERTLYPYEL